MVSVVSINPWFSADYTWVYEQYLGSATWLSVLLIRTPQRALMESLEWTARSQGGRGGLSGSETWTGPPSRSSHHNPKAAPAPELTVGSVPPPLSQRTSTFHKSGLEPPSNPPGAHRENTPASPPHPDTHRQACHATSQERRKLTRRHTWPQPVWPCSRTLHLHKGGGFLRLKPDPCLLRAETRLRGPQASIIRKYTLPLSLSSFPK